MKIPRLTTRQALLVVQLIFTIALTAWLLSDFNWGSFLELFRSLPVWFAGVRDWQHGWLKVLQTAKERYEYLMKNDLGYEVEIYQPPS